MDSKNISRFWAKVDKNGPIIYEHLGKCWVWTGWTNELGYGLVSRVEGIRRLHRAHRVSWTLTNGKIPDGLLVLHRCDNPACVNPEHTFLGTHADNIRDKMEKGRGGHLRGEEAGRAKLTENEVREIRKMRGEGAVYPVIARRFGVSESTIAAIIRGRSWKHLPP